MREKQWQINIYIDEADDRTRAEARWRTRTRSR